ncbi:MAG: type IV toxin-antitoxin system AbiEi family antitoxin domain-containing protein [Erysipelotrichaceae bacterium]
MKWNELVENNITVRIIENLINQGYVEKMKFGYYQWIDNPIFSEPALINKLFPDAIVCMESALQYYEYTNRTPSTWNLAVDKNSSKSRFRIEYPIVKPYYIPSEQMSIGVDVIEIENVKLRIFNRERTIIDCLRRENKMDAEVFNKAIQSYIKDPKKNIPRLMDYAKRLRIEYKVRRMIGIWL